MPEIEVADVESIISFNGCYRFLSNFYEPRRPILWSGREWPSSEHAYQAEKTTFRNEKLAIMRCSTPGQAKRQGNNRQLTTLREDWGIRKHAVMFGILRAKFSDDALRSMLSGTGEAILIEGNHWHDNYWGVCWCDKCPGNGQNILGRQLMQVRSRAS